MNDEAMELLFRTLGQILNNQNKIMKHLNITNKGEWRTIDDSENLEYDLFDFSTKYEH